MYNKDSLQYHGIEIIEFRNLCVENKSFSVFSNETPKSRAPPLIQYTLFQGLGRSKNKNESPPPSTLVFTVNFPSLKSISGYGKQVPKCKPFILNTQITEFNNFDSMIL